ncbi:MAG: hypothetical protein JXA79_12660 [Deltaproteobacteria bacterium]|nr:hypothetical protein [Deltaproteobacteria bacterium]
MKKVLIIFCLGMLGIVLYSGCQGLQYKSNYHMDSQSLKGVKSLAVLPFHNLSQRTNAGIIMTNVLMAELIKLEKFRLIKYGDVRKFFLIRRKISVSTIDLETLKALRKEFKVEAVIIGTVLQYGAESDAGTNPRKDEKSTLPKITVHSTILDTRSGRILGQGQFMEKGTAQGYLLGLKDRQTAFSLAQKVAQRLASAIGNDEV